MYPSPLKGINSTVLSKSQTWMTAATHSEFSIKSNFCLKDIPTSPGLCFDEEKVHNIAKALLQVCNCYKGSLGGF